MQASADMRLSAHRLLSDLGYAESLYLEEYPVSLGQQGTTFLDIVAFAMESPKDMSTATAVIEFKQTAQEPLTDQTLAAAEILAAPLVIQISPRSTGFFANTGKGSATRLELIDSRDASAARRWAEKLGPRTLFEAKLGQRQLAIFPADVSFVRLAEQKIVSLLGPLVEAALATASEMTRDTLFEVYDSESAERKHQRAARLVVGALTALALRDKEGLPQFTAASLADASQQRLGKYFSWLQETTDLERATFEVLIDELGRDINYVSLDPRVLSHVYETSLVSDASRRQLGTFYTPPGLARRMLEALPIETLPPQSLSALDPTCGSGTLLLAAFDRFRALTTEPMTDGSIISPKVRGYDMDAFAVELAQLSLLLNAYPESEGWGVERRDTLSLAPASQHSPGVIVANPPWRHSNVGRRQERADAFVNWMLDALPEHGLLAVVLPSGWLVNRASEATRQRLNSLCDILEVWRLPDRVFNSAALAPAVVFAQRLPINGTRRPARLYKRVLQKSDLNAFYATGRGAEVTLTRDEDNVHTLPLAYGPLSQAFGGKDYVKLEDLATVTAGPQPLPREQRGQSPEAGTRVLYLNKARFLKAFTQPAAHDLEVLTFPSDFQGGRGSSGVGRTKVLVSAASSSDNPWRLKVGIDTQGILVRNSLHMVVPKASDESVPAAALMAFLGSGFASAWIDETVTDRNVSASDVRGIPVPVGVDWWRLLETVGLRLLEGGPQVPLLRDLEAVVWKAMDIDSWARGQVEARLSRFTPPDGGMRYESLRAGGKVAPGYEADEYETYGACHDVRNGEVLIEFPGFPASWVQVPSGMTGWMTQMGSNFRLLTRGPQGLASAEFLYQPGSWLSLQDIEALVADLQIQGSAR